MTSRWRCDNSTTFSRGPRKSDQLYQRTRWKCNCGPSIMMVPTSHVAAVPASSSSVPLCSRWDDNRWIFLGAEQREAPDPVARDCYVTGEHTLNGFTSPGQSHRGNNGLGFFCFFLMADHQCHTQSVGVFCIFSHLFIWISRPDIQIARWQKQVLQVDAELICCNLRCPLESRISDPSA